MDKKSAYFKIYNTPLLNNVLALITLTTILIIYRFPVILNINTHLFGGSKQDAGLYYWLFNYNRNFIDKLWYDAPIFYPYTETLAWSDNFILPSLITSPLTWLGLTITAQYNLTLLVALLLNGFSIFYLSYSITGKYLISLASGLFILLSSYVNENLGHPQLVFIFWIPLALICLCKFYAKKNSIYLFLCGLTISFCFLTTVYYALFIIVTLIILSITLFILNPSYLKLNNYPKYVSIFSLGLLPLIPFLMPYLNTQKLYGERALYEAYHFSANALSYFSASKTNFLYGQLLSFNFSNIKVFSGIILIVVLIFSFLRLYDLKEHRRVLIASISFFILGLILTSFDLSIIKVIATILIWLAIFSFLYFSYHLGIAERALGSQIFTNRNFIALFLFAIIVSISLSLGPIINPQDLDYSFSPFAVFYYLIPGVSSIRSVDRFFIITLIFNILLIPFVLEFYLTKYKNIKAWQVLFILLMILEQYSNLYPLEELPGFNYPINELDKYEKNDSSIIVLPLQNNIKNSLEPLSYADYNIKAMFWSLNSNYKLVNGYSGQVPKLHKTYINSLKNFPDNRSIEELRKISNLKFIKLYGNDYPNFISQNFEDKLKNYSEIKIITKDLNNTYILEFNPLNELDNNLVYIPNKNGIFKIELQSFSTNNCFIEIYNNASNTLLSKFEIISDSNFNEYSLPISKNITSQKPLTLELKKVCDNNASESKVFIRERKFTN